MRNPELIYQNESDQELYTQMDLSLGEHLHSLHVLAATIASTPEKPNEDAFALVQKDDIVFAGLFDGTTSLKPIKSLGTQTGARFASHFLKDNFSPLSATESPRDFLLRLNKQLLAKSLTFEGALLPDTHTLPASTGTVIKLDPDTNRLSFAHVGDSYGIAYFTDGSSAIFTDDKNGRFDARMFALIEQIAREKGISPRQARDDERVKQALIEMFIERNNNPAGTGSGLINGDPHVQLYIQTGTIPLDNVSAIFLGSDGLLPQGWSLTNGTDRQRIVDTLRTGGFKQLFALKHESEDADPDWQHIRYKHSDDATGMLLDIKR